MLDHIAEGVFLLDPDRRVVLLNPAAASMFGWSQQSIVGKMRDEVLAEVARLAKDPDDLRRKLRVPATGAYVLHGEFELRLPQRRVVRWTTKPVEIQGGVGHLIVTADITAESDLLRERAEITID